MLRGQPSVYSTETASLSFMTTKPFDVLDKFTFIPNIEDVDRIEITAAGKTHVLAITRTTKKAEKAGEADEVTATYTMDGKSADEENFKKFYQVLIGLQIEGEVKHAVPDKPEVVGALHAEQGGREDGDRGFRPVRPGLLRGLRTTGRASSPSRSQQVRQMLAKLDAPAAGREDYRLSR